MIPQKFTKVFEFTRVNFVLQKKNSLIGFSLGIIPLVVTALAIELFIGKLIDGRNPGIPGLRANNIIVFQFFSSWLTNVFTVSKKFRNMLKNTPLELETVKLSEALLITLNTVCACLIVNIILGTPANQVMEFLLIIGLLAVFLLPLSSSVLSLPLIFADYDRVVGICLQLTFWLSPIVYQIRDLAGWLQLLFCLNPLNFFFELNLISLRADLFYSTYLFVSFTALAGLYLIASFAFRKLKIRIELLY